MGRFSFFTKNSVSNRIILYFAVIVTATIAVLTAANIIYSSGRLSDSLSDKSTVVIQAMAEASVDAMSVGDTEKLTLAVQNLKAGDSDVVYAMMVSAEGKCVGSTEENMVGQDVAATDSGRKAMAVQELTVLRDLPKGNQFRVVQPVRFVFNKIGYLEIGYSTANINSVSRKAALISALIGLFSLLAGIAVYYRNIRRNITAPLAEVMSASSKIAQGDLTNKAIPVMSDDEIGRLADTFNKMAEGLRTLITLVGQLSGSATKSAADVAQTTVQASEAMKQIQSSISQIASATSNVAGSAQEITGLLQNANQDVEKGTANISKVMSSFTNVQNIIKSTDTSVGQLNERSKEIAGILELITKIADQTNLLALNAAIEAARAGDAGRGFAVVADEVRRLAESSSSSAEKIAAIVRKIQGDTAGVVAASASSIAETKTVFELMNHMQQGYGQIVDSIKGISRHVEQIAATAEETAASAEEVTAGSQEQSSAMGTIAASAQELTAQAKSLQSQISVFKV